MVSEVLVIIKLEDLILCPHRAVEDPEYFEELWPTDTQSLGVSRTNPDLLDSFFF
jgi:hypothetical protein